MNTKSEHILLVEDDEAMCLLMRSYLEKAGYQVSVANNRVMFYSLLEDDSICLILLDLNLPDGDGMDIARHLRKSSSVPIIMVTARDKDSDRIAGLESPIRDP